jgi:hypothetical protein
MRSEFMRVGALTIAVFFCLAAVEVALLAAVAGRGPNDLSAPLVEQFRLLTMLWHSNPAAALPVIAQHPVFVIAHHEPAASIQTWGLYYFPLTFVTHLAIALVAALLLRRPAGRPRCLPWLTAGGAALAFAVTYTRFATCCTGGPRWAFDVWLFALAFDPTRSQIDWSALYARMEAFFPFMQFATGAVGIAFLIVAARRMRTR